MDIAKRITELREEAGENRKEFSVHTGIPVRTLEDWEAGRRTPPEYIPRLIEYQLKYEKLQKSNRNIWNLKNVAKRNVRCTLQRIGSRAMIHIPQCVEDD